MKSTKAGAFAIGYRFSLFWLLTSAFLYCGGIELLQIPLPTRHARVSVFLIDFAAAAIAMVLVRRGEPFMLSLTKRPHPDAGSGRTL